MTSTSCANRLFTLIPTVSALRTVINVVFSTSVLGMLDSEGFYSIDVLFRSARAISELCKRALFRPFTRNRLFVVLVAGSCVPLRAESRVCNSDENTICPFLYRSKFVNADNMCEYNLCNKNYYNEKNKPMGVRPLLGPSKGTNS